MTRPIFLLAALCLFAASDATAQYPWPVEPFHDSHEITGAFLEYRDTGSSPHFHDAVDIPKPDRSPVYSVADGRVTGFGGDWLRVDNFAYVHIVPSPALAVGDSAFAGETIVGTIMDGYGHVHFKDGQPNSERQPLRENGGLTPFVDDWAPTIDNVRFYSQPTRQRLGSGELAGLIEITFRVREPGGPPWSNEARQNNGAYLVGYKILSRDRQEEIYVPPNDGVRFQFDVKPSNSYVHNVYDRLQSSTSSHVYIVTNDLHQASALDASQLDEDDYTVLLFAEDTRGNRAEYFADVTVQHRDILPPPEPTLSTVLADQDEQLVRWTGDEVDDLAGFRLYRSPALQAAAEWTQVALAAPEERSLQFVPQSDAAYFHLTAIDTVGQPNESDETDTYGFRPDPHGRRLLIVDGFDRFGSPGSWHLPRHNFAALHGRAIAAAGFGFETAANEAVVAGHVDLSDYDAVFWMLGDESTVDETFSTAEQTRVRSYLEAGGRLFVSGSEIAWDLDNRGSSADRAFLRHYLKVAFANDDAGSTLVTGVEGGIFDGANLRYGSSPYVEDYPDDYAPVEGGVATLQYGNGRVAAVEYSGPFGSSTAEGQVVTVGFPFETITGERTQAALMERVLHFFFPDATAADDPQTLPARLHLSMPYPNPATNHATMTVDLPSPDVISVSAYDVLGRRVATLAEGPYAAGSHSLRWRTELAPGVYFIRLDAGGRSVTRRVTVVR